MHWITTRYGSKCRECNQFMPPGSKALVIDGKKGLTCSAHKAEKSSQPRRLTMQQAFDMQKPL